MRPFQFIPTRPFVITRSDRSSFSSNLSPFPKSPEMRLSFCSSVILTSSSSCFATIALARGVAPTLTRLFPQSNVMGPRFPINLLPSNSVGSVLSSTCMRYFLKFSKLDFHVEVPYDLTGLLHKPYTSLGAGITSPSNSNRYRVPTSITLGLSPVSSIAAVPTIVKFI